MEKIGADNVDEFKKAALSSVVTAVRHANALPAPGDDFDFYSSYDGFRHFSQRQGSHIKQLIGSLLQQQNINSTWMAQGQASAEDCEDELESLIEANDSILERVGILLDEATGVRHAEPVQASLVTAGDTSPAVASWNKDKTAAGSRTPKSARLIHSKTVMRPQLLFKDGVDNSTAPFVPKLTEKPNARVPLRQVAKKDATDGPASAVDMLLNSARQGKALDPDLHPYEFELLQWEPTSDLLQPVKEQLYEPVAKTRLTLVDTVEQLEELCASLRSQSEIAVDLEAHSYRTFQGFTCLMQISTRTEDFLVDTLKLRTDLIVLNEFFTDPKIVKVLHGCDSDVVWLQRDHGLYLVNVFDTGQAARVLEMPRFGLAYLLQFYCSVTANKQFQLADWRVRPLPEELINYAREDTHYLLYIYDRMRNELINKGTKGSNYLGSVWTKSRDLCLKRYEKPEFKEHSHLVLHEKHKKRFNAPQMEALKLLYAWRDKTSRRDDESPGYVLPNEMLFQISQNLPRELQGILACCNPVPLLVRQNVQEIYQMVSQARLIPTNAPVPKLPSEFRSRHGGTPHKGSQAAQAKRSTPAKTHGLLKKSGDAVPVREFSHGLAISGPPIPMTSAQQTALVTLPRVVTKKSLLTAAEREVVENIILPTGATGAPVTTPSASSDAQNDQDVLATSAMLVSPLQAPAKVAEEPMEEVAVKTEDGDVSRHPIWGKATSRATADSNAEAEAEAAAKAAPEAKPLRSLMANKGSLKRKHDDGAKKVKTETLDDKADEEEFEPFDYDTAHKSAAEKAEADRKQAKSHSKSSKSSRAGQAKKRAIDPTKDASSFKTPTRSRVSTKSGERSKTFSDKKSSSNVQWPKR